MSSRQAERRKAIHAAFSRPAPKVDPTQWHGSVVRALSTRLPYGEAAVTDECDLCGSKFCPCLCSLKGNTHGPDVHHLRAPRVVQASETMRLDANRTKPMGSLDQVTHHVFTHGVDGKRLFLGELPNSPEGIISSRPKSCGVVTRRGSRYVLEPDVTNNNENWAQELRLSKDELVKLRQYVEDRGGELLISGKPPEVDIKRIMLTYQSRSKACSDMVLEQTPHAQPAPAKESEEGQAPVQPYEPFRVVRVKPDGEAAKAHVCPGQLAIGLEHPCYKTNDPCKGEAWKTCTHRSPISMDCMPGVWKQDAPAEQVKTKDGTLEPPFPCCVILEALPNGWYLKKEAGEGKPPLTMRRLTQLAEGAGGATIVFQRTKEILVRRGQIERHEHMWERAVQLQTSKDEQMLRQWGVNFDSNGKPNLQHLQLTPAQLEYTFNRLIKIVSADLAAFEETRAKNEKLVVQKCCRAVMINLKAELEAREQQGVQTLTLNPAQLQAPLLSIEDRSRPDLQIVRRDIDYICNNVPLYFLVEIRDACRRRAEFARLGDPGSPTRPGHGHTGEDFGKPEDQVLVATMNRLKALVPQVWRKGERCDEKDVDAVLGFLESEVHYFLRENKAKTKLGRESNDANPKTDGRMSKREFEHALFSAGVSWLTQKDMHQKFDTLDLDNSGYLSLGEVLKSAHHMRHFARKLGDMIDKETTKVKQSGLSSTGRQIFRDTP